LYAAGRPGASSYLFRQNITTGTNADGTTKLTKQGVPLTVNLKIVDFSNGCTPMAGYNVYIWHCDASGLYSGYSITGNAGQAANNYLRGYYTTGSDGTVSFTSIVPGAYTGRWPHIHCVVSISDTTDAVTQFAFPAATLTAAYANSNYTSSRTVFSGSSYASDGIFGGSSYYQANVCGDVTSGFTSYWTIGVVTSPLCADATSANRSSTGQLGSGASPW
jgi:hypothetical protein